MWVVKILKNIVRLLNIHHNKNIILMFYIKYSINAFQKNNIQNAKNKKENVEIMKNYLLNVLQIVIKFFIFL